IRFQHGSCTIPRGRSSRLRGGPPSLRPARDLLDRDRSTPWHVESVPTGARGAGHGTRRTGRAARGETGASAAVGPRTRRTAGPSSTAGRTRNGTADPPPSAIHGRTARVGRSIRAKTGGHGVSAVQRGSPNTTTGCAGRAAGRVERAAATSPGTMKGTQDHRAGGILAAGEAQANAASGAEDAPANAVLAPVAATAGIAPTTGDDPVRRETRARGTGPLLVRR